MLKTAHWRRFVCFNHAWASLSKSWPWCLVYVSLDRCHGHEADTFASSKILIRRLTSIIWQWCLKFCLYFLFYGFAADSWSISQAQSNDTNTRAQKWLVIAHYRVPQGSVLGPLLFSIYVNDIATNIKASISLFADVTTLLHSDKCTVHLHSVLTQDLCTLHRWSELWNVTFNPQKTAVMTISKYRNDHPPLLFNNTHLSETDRHKHLGSLFHHILSWHTHIVNLHHKVMTKINRLRSFGNLVPRHVLLTIYKTNILPVFDYGNIIYDNCCDYGNRMLDKAQLSAAKIIVGCLKLHPLTMY